MNLRDILLDLRDLQRRMDAVEKQLKLLGMPTQPGPTGMPTQPRPNMPTQPTPQQDEEPVRRGPGRPRKVIDGQV